MIDLKNDLGLNIQQHEANDFSRKQAYINALTQKSIGTGLDGNSINLTDKQSEYLYRLQEESATATPKRAEKLKEEYNYARNAFQSEADRTSGHYAEKGYSGKWTKGSESGAGIGFKAHMYGSQRSLLANSWRGSVQLVGEGLSNSLGYATKQQRLQYKTGGLMAKGMTAFTIGTGAYNLISTGINGGDMYDAMSDNLSFAAGMVGFHAGSKLGGAMSNVRKVGDKTVGLKRRAVGSAIGGIGGNLVASQLVSGGLSAIKDMGSSDSQIVKTLKGQTLVTGGLGNITDNNKTLTMRQRSLQQLSQSSMNDRASILGSEASILRGYM